MKKRAMSIAAALVLVVSMLFAAMDVSASGSNVVAKGNGFTNVEFSNGFRGYCLDNRLTGAYVDREYTVSDTSAAKSNTADSKDLSRLLKQLITQCFTDFFEIDSTGNYPIRDNGASNIQKIIYYHTDPDLNSYLDKKQTDLLNKAKAYDGPAIPDSGYILTLENGDKITFDFMVLKATDSDYQDFFAYKIGVTKAGGHTHNYSEDWESNEDKHWKECSCGDKTEEGFHEGGEATCTDKPICEKCETPYGTTDPENHVGETEVRDALEPTEEEPGYTGDTYCESCETLLEEGSEIPPLGGSSGEDEEGTTEGDSETTEGEDETTTEGEDETTTEGEEETTTEETEGTTSETDEGATSEKEEAPAVNNEDSGPDTGDKSMIWTYLAVIVISFAGCVIGFVKKKNSNI